jgi:uncharacterized membrane protein YfcA
VVFFHFFAKTIARMSKKKRTKFLIGAGTAVGFVTGLLGGGGGMLAVPALSKVGLEAKQAHATAILVIFPISLMSAIVYLVGGHVDGFALTFAGLGIVVGGALGARLLNKLDSVVIRIVFAVVMTAVGLKCLLGG